MHSTSTNPFSVESGGDGVAAHVGLLALGALANRLQLGALLSSRILSAAVNADPCTTGARC